MITWERALIRFGFRFRREGDAFLLERETTDNIGFLRELMAESKSAGALQDYVFIPALSEVEELRIIEAYDRIHGGSEGGPWGYDNIRLCVMDTCMSGVIRWLNGIGIDTNTSCEGHPNGMYLRLNDPRQGPLLDLCLVVASGGRWHYDLTTSKPLFLDEATSREEGHSLGTRRLNLLDLAEGLYNNMRYLRDVAKLLNIN